MHFQVHIKTDAHVIQGFIQFLHDSFCRIDTTHSNQNQIQYFHVLPSQHLLFIFQKKYFIICAVNKHIILFLPVKYLSVCGLVTAVLSMPNLIILRTKVS